jgi:hypothetical protein
MKREFIRTRIFEEDWKNAGLNDADILNITRATEAVAPTWLCPTFATALMPTAVYILFTV